MEAPKISIVIPSRNVADVIGETLESVARQSMQDYEVICIDDNSVDETLAVINSYAERDKRIRVCKSPAFGAAAARNYGIDIATGSALMFLDSDDLLLPTALEDLYASLMEDDAEITICEMSRYDHFTGSITPYYSLPSDIEERTYHIENIAHNLFQKLNIGLCNKLYRMDAIVKKGFKFQNLPNAEDALFVVSNLAFAKRVSFVKRALYLYRIGRGSSLEDRVICKPLGPLLAAERLFIDIAEHVDSNELLLSLKNICWVLCVRSIEKSFSFHRNENEAYSKMNTLAACMELNKFSIRDFVGFSFAYRYIVYTHTTQQGLEWVYRLRRKTRGKQTVHYKALLALRLLVAVAIFNKSIRITPVVKKANS